MQVLLPSVALGAHKFTKWSTPAEMTGLNELISEEGLMESTDGFCSPRCSKKEVELFTATTKKMEIQQRPLKKAAGTSLLFKSHVLHLRKQFICLCSI